MSMLPLLVAGVKKPPMPAPAPFELVIETVVLVEAVLEAEPEVALPALVLFEVIALPVEAF